MPYGLSKEDYQELHELLADEIESAELGLHAGEVTILKQVGTVRRRLLHVKQQHFIVLRIETRNLSDEQRVALGDVGWSHHMPFADALAVGGLASVIGLITGSIGWIVAGVASGAVAISAQRLPYWRAWESVSGSFNYMAIADAILEANLILLDDDLSILKIDLIDIEKHKKKKRA